MPTFQPRTYYVFDAPGLEPRYTVVFIQSKGVADGEKWYPILGVQSDGKTHQGLLPYRIDIKHRPKLGNKLKDDEVPDFVKIAARMMR